MRVAIGLGGNLGDRRANLDAARRALIGLPGTRAHRFSSLYETEAVGPPQPPYLNAVAVVELEPTRSPRSMVAALLAVEHELGRVRPAERDAPRTVDLDLLWMEGVVSRHKDAEVPHPRLHLRAFALVPLVEVLPEALDPAGVSYTTHLAGLDPSSVRRVVDGW